MVVGEGLSRGEVYWGDGGCDGMVDMVPVEEVMEVEGVVVGWLRLHFGCVFASVRGLGREVRLLRSSLGMVDFERVCCCCCCWEKGKVVGREDEFWWVHCWGT